MMRLVDIFAGCGGLSLGFDLQNDSTTYRTCLAIDNEPSATRLFNSNFGQLHPEYGQEIARTADVCWFESADEIRLFYLSHIAKLEGDQELRTRLLQLGFGRMLAEIRSLDTDCQAKLSLIACQRGFSAAASEVDPATYNLASVKKVLRTLGVRAFQRPGPDQRYLPWSDECLDRFWTVAEVPKADKASPPDDHFRATLWLQATEPLRAGAVKEGRGQHAGNGRRYASLASLLAGSWGKQLEAVITMWRYRRTQVIQNFANEVGPAIEEIYLRDYRVAGLLGGPPCKGFSRIGRPVANSLRSQGVFAWSNSEFGDERNKLVLHYVMFLEALKPSFFVFENVSNFQSSLKTPDGEIQADQIFAEAVANLSSSRLCYDVAAKQLKATAFGVPQARIRYIMFGVNQEFSTCRASAFFDLPNQEREITVTEAFFGLPAPAEFTPSNGVKTSTTTTCAKILPPASDRALSNYFDWIQRSIDQNRSETDAHIYRRMRADDAAFFQFIGPGIRWMDWELRGSSTLNAMKKALSGSKSLAPLAEGNLALRLILEETASRFGLKEQHLLHSSYLKNRSGTHGDWLERLAGDRPAKTVVAHIGKDTYGYIHPSETRPITIREAARLQSFPDSFSFAAAGVVDAYSAIGNAVPPLLASAFARRIAAIMFRNSERAKEVNILVPLRRSHA